MARHTSAETSKWVASNLREAEGVSNIEVLADQVLRVSRTKYGPYVAGIVSATRVEALTILGIIESGFDVEIIVNVPSESFWTGAALNLASSNHIAAGAYGDLFRVIRSPDVRTFVPSEIEFVERGLRQHSRISSFERVHDRLYRLERDGLPDLTVAILNEYELTADHLRTACDRYGKFSVAVITNPNGNPTSSAEGVAQDLGIEILNWRPFFSRLHAE